MAQIGFVLAVVVLSDQVLHAGDLIINPFRQDTIGVDDDRVHEGQAAMLEDPLDVRQRHADAGAATDLDVRSNGLEHRVVDLHHLGVHLGALLAGDPRDPPVLAGRAITTPVPLNSFQTSTCLSWVP